MSFKQLLGGGRALLGGEGCSRESTQLMLSCRGWAERALGELRRKGEGIYQQKRFSLDSGRSISKRKGKKDTTVGNISNGKTRILTLIIKTVFPHKNSMFFPVGIVGNYTNQCKIFLVCIFGFFDGKNADRNKQLLLVPWL